MAQEEKNDLDLLGKFIKTVGGQEQVDARHQEVVKNLKRLIELIRSEIANLKEEQHELDPQKDKGEIERLQGLIDKYENSIPKLLSETILKKVDLELLIRSEKIVKGAEESEIPLMTLDQLEEVIELIRDELDKLKGEIGELTICHGNAELLKDAKPTEQYELSYVPRLKEIPDVLLSRHRLLVYDYDNPAVVQRIKVIAQSPCFDTHIEQKIILYKEGDIKLDRYADGHERRYENHHEDRRLYHRYFYPFPPCLLDYYQLLGFKLAYDGETIHQKHDVKEFGKCYTTTDDVSLLTNYQPVKQIPEGFYQQRVYANFEARVYDKDYPSVDYHEKCERSLVAAQFRVNVAIRNCFDCPNKNNLQNIDAKTAALSAAVEIDKLQKNLQEITGKYEAAIQKLLLRE